MYNKFTIQIETEEERQETTNVYSDEMLKNLSLNTNHGFILDSDGLKVALDAIEGLYLVPCKNYSLHCADGCDGEYVSYRIEVDGDVYDVLVIWEEV